MPQIIRASDIGFCMGVRPLESGLIRPADFALIRRDDEEANVAKSLKPKTFNLHWGSGIVEGAVRVVRRPPDHVVVDVALGGPDPAVRNLDHHAGVLPRRHHRARRHEALDRPRPRLRTSIRRTATPEPRTPADGVTAAPASRSPTGALTTTRCTPLTTPTGTRRPVPDARPPAACW